MEKSNDLANGQNSPETAKKGRDQKDLAKAYKAYRKGVSEPLDFEEWLVQEGVSGQDQKVSELYKVYREGTLYPLEFKDWLHWCTNRKGYAAHDTFIESLNRQIANLHAEVFVLEAENDSLKKRVRVYKSLFWSSCVVLVLSVLLLSC